MKALYEALPGRICQTRALTEAEVVERGYSMKGVLGYAEGIFSVCDVENKNHRIYESVLWEQQLTSERITEMVRGKLLLGEPDHPETRTQSVIREGSHTVVEVHKDGRYVRGVVAIFDNPLGRIVWPMLEAGVKLGFSTRGDGDLIEERGGKTRVDPNTFEWHGVDFVLNPSFVEARPESISEDVKTRVRRAITEAVESRRVTENVNDESMHNTKVMEEIVKDVEQLLAKPPASVEEGAEDVVSANPTKGLEAALAQLESVHSEVFERDQQIATLCAEIEGLKGKIASLESKQSEATTAVSEANKKAAAERAQRLKVESDAKNERAQFKRMIAETQQAQQEFAGTHRDLQVEHAQVGAKYRRAVQVVEALRGKLNEAAARATAAEQKLKEQVSRVPQEVRAEALKTYKRIRTEGVEVPAKFRPLLERAQSEADVDTILESVRAEHASHFRGLPIFTEHSREDRAALANRLTEETESTQEGQRDDQDDADEQEMYRVARASFRR